jgi:hypothetical protein
MLRRMPFYGDFVIFRGSLSILLAEEDYMIPEEKSGRGSGPVRRVLGNSVRKHPHAHQRHQLGPCLSHPRARISFLLRIIMRIGDPTCHFNPLRAAADELRKGREASL